VKIESFGENYMNLFRLPRTTLVSLSFLPLLTCLSLGILVNTVLSPDVAFGQAGVAQPDYMIHAAPVTAAPADPAIAGANWNRQDLT